MQGQATGAAAPTTEAAPSVALHSRAYLSLLLLSAVIGVPLSLIAFGFLAAVHELEHLVWETLPAGLGFETLPAWWPILTLGTAGVLVALTVKHLPGGGGHVPAMGLAAGATPPSAVPGTILAAGTSLVLGAVVGPEAPLIAIGSGLALLAVSRTRVAADATATAMVAAAGSAAAISAIFGNPLVAAVIFMEVVGLARRQTMLIVLPCLVSSGVGALVFTGLGEWTGLGYGELSLPDLSRARLTATDVAWAVPLAAVVSVGMWAVFVVGRRTAHLATSRLVATTVGAGLTAGCSAAVYALVSGHSPAEVALSGQAALSTLASDPAAWSAVALVQLLLCKGIAYALCIGVFRGGPVFPALFLGACAGVLAATTTPLGTVAGLAIGMAAGAAVTGLPVTSVLMVVLLLGDAAAEQMPVVILATVTAFVVGELLSARTGPAAVPADH